MRIDPAEITLMDGRNAEYRGWSFAIEFNDHLEALIAARQATGLAAADLPADLKVDYLRRALAQRLEAEFEAMSHHQRMTFLARTELG